MFCSVVVISPRPEFSPELADYENFNDTEKELYDETIQRKPQDPVHNLLVPK